MGTYYIGSSWNNNNNTHTFTSMFTNYKLDTSFDVALPLTSWNRGVNDRITLIYTNEYEWQRSEVQLINMILNISIVCFVLA